MVDSACQMTAGLLSSTQPSLASVPVADAHIASRTASSKTTGKLHRQVPVARLLAWQ